MVVITPRGNGLALQEGEALPKTALKYSNLQSIMAFISTFLVLLALAFFVPVGWVSHIALWILLPLSGLVVLVDLLLVNRLQYRSYRYSVSRSTVEIRHGILFRSQTTISTVQILSIDTVQGPILRGCRLASVVFRTVGGTVKLGPVAPEVADGIRGQVLGALETELS